MAANGPGLDYVLDRSLEEWRGQPSELRSVYGAAGRVGESLDRELADLVESRAAKMPSIQAFTSQDPYTRMFSTDVGQRAVQAVGNETRTLMALGRLSVEVIADALKSTDTVADDDRLLVVPSQGAERPPVLILMSPRVADASQSRTISAGLDLSFQQLKAHLDNVADLDDGTPEALALREVLNGGVQAVIEMFTIARPEVVLTRRPHMIRLCVPAPHLEVRQGGTLSTAGVICRDASGEIGVTACYHGTGPSGTPVTVNSRQSAVKRASEVQDLVFIPGSFVADGSRKLTGLRGVLQDREPARSDRVRFDGATNQNRETRIYSTDAGLLRARPNIMLKLQTGAETDQGDSGCALRDAADRVLGFAFERTAYDDDPQFTDWIWAANALRALQLTT